MPSLLKERFHQSRDVIDDVCLCCQVFFCSLMIHRNMFPVETALEALEGSKIGDEVEVSLSPAEGFGEHDPSMTFSDAIDNVPPEYRHIGAEATFENEQGESITMTVVKMEDGKIMLDGNHPFAGKTVTFKLRVKEIREATEAEVGSGEVAQQDKPLLH